jgi:hypothetical protein
MNHEKQEFRYTNLGNSLLEAEGEREGEGIMRVSEAEVVKGEGCIWNEAIFVGQWLEVHGQSHYREIHPTLNHIF